VTDEDCPIDEGIVEDRCDVIGKILDGNARGITRRSGAPVTTVMRMEGEPGAYVLA
jgi:hypothetical protein